MSDMLYRDNTCGYNTAMPKTKPLNFRFDPDLMVRMSAHAVREGRSRNNLIEHIMRAYDSDERIRDLVRHYVDPAPVSE